MRDTVLYVPVTVGTAGASGTEAARTEVEVEDGPSPTKF